MKNKQIVITNQDSKLPLQKSKNLFDITRKILDKKELIESFLFKPFIMESAHTDRITTISISESEKYIVSGSIDRTLKIWTFDTLECLCTFDNFNRVDLVKITPCENYIISEYCEEFEVYSKQIIKVWDIKNKECLNSLEITWENSRKRYRRILISPNSEYFVLEFDNEIKIFNLLSKECLNSFIGHNIDITPDSNYIFFINDKCKLIKFNIKQNEFFDICDTEKFITSNDKKYLIIIYNEEIKVYNYETNAYLFTVGECEDLILMTIDDNNKYVATLDATGTIKVWDINTKKCINTLNANENEISYKQYGELRIPSTKYIALSEYNNFINIFNEKVVEALKINNYKEYMVSIDNRYIVFGYDDGRIEVFNVEKNNYISSQLGNDLLVDLELNNNFLILRLDSGIIKILDLKNNNYFAKFKSDLNPIGSIFISPDKNYVLIENYDKKIDVFDISRQKFIDNIHLDKNHFLLNYKYIVNQDLSNKITKVLNLKTKECIFSYENNVSIGRKIVISDDEKYLIMEVAFQKIKIYNLQTNEFIQTFKTKLFSIDLLKISIDNKKLIIISNIENFDTYPKYETKVEIWDIKTGQCLDILENELDNIILFDIIDDKYILLGQKEERFASNTIKILKIIDKNTKKLIYISNYDLCSIDFKQRAIFYANKYGLIKKIDIKTKKFLGALDIYNNISIDENGYFISKDKNIDKYLRVSEELLSQRKLTNEEINHFRKKDNFLEIGEIIKKPIFE